MKISVDGGGISSKSSQTFGNGNFVKNFLRAISEYDKKNQYFIYTFNRDQRILDKENLFFQVLMPATGWMKLRVPFEEFISPKDIFLAINQAVPLHSAKKIITFSHGLSFYFYKDLYKDYAHLNLQLQQMRNKSTFILVSSLKVKKELQSIGFDERKVVVAPFGIPYEYKNTTLRKREQFFLFSGMNHPIKNVNFIIQAFSEVIKLKEFAHFKLHLCGPFEEYESDTIKVVPYSNLKREYQQASAYLSASFYESFNFPVLEALSQNCPVIGMNTAIIPEMRKFVHLASTESEFISHIKTIAKGKSNKINLKTLQKTFSWNTYVKTVIRLYNE
ncbi:MAG: glycosyltransferase [Patescibacteria group bacterium]